MTLYWLIHYSLYLSTIICLFVYYSFVIEYHSSHLMFGFLLIIFYYSPLIYVTFLKPFILHYLTLVFISASFIAPYPFDSLKSWAPHLDFLTSKPRLITTDLLSYIVNYALLNSIPNCLINQFALVRSSQYFINSKFITSIFHSHFQEF